MEERLMAKKTAVVMGVACRRCGGTSSITIDPEVGYDPDYVWACPHCFDESMEAEYILGKRYDIMGFKPTTHDYDASHSIETVQYDLGSLTEYQYTDFIEVRCRGKSYTERGVERGVVRGTIHESVATAAEKIGVIN